MKGYMQVYTGNGKGKTTAALGLALRALGAGKSVYVGQFVKLGRYSEITALETLARAMPANRCTCEQFGRARKAGSPFDDEDREVARGGLKRSLEVLSGGTYDLTILDELNLALGRGLLNEEDFRALLTAKNDTTELVITGRDAPQYVIDAADLVTEMHPIKHYFEAGVTARVGTEY